MLLLLMVGLIPGRRLEERMFIVVLLVIGYIHRVARGSRGRPAMAALEGRARVLPHRIQSDRVGLSLSRGRSQEVHGHVVEHHRRRAM